MQEIHLKILHTNDLHSHLEQASRIAAAFRRIRSGMPQSQVLTLDIGDHLDRVCLETEGTGGICNVDIMNATGYQYAVFGNNEGLTYPMEQLKQLVSTKARYKVIASNMLDIDSGRVPEWLSGYELVDMAGIAVGLIGVTADFNDFYHHLGWHLADPLATVRQIVHQIRDQADVVVVLSHLGLARDEQLASTVPDIDLIIGGHTHHLLEEPVFVGRTMICASGKFGQHYGEIDLMIDRETKAITRRQARCAPVEHENPQTDIEQMIVKYRKQAEHLLSTTVARLAEPLPLSWKRESPLGNLLASGLRRWTGADIGIVNAGQILAGLEAGAVSRGMLHRICPGPINPCRMLLSGAHILQALEQSLLPEFIHQLIRGFGFRGRELGTLCLDGMTVEYDADNPPYSKIEQVYVHGEPLDTRRTYLVGTIDMFTFGIGYPSIKNGCDLQYFLPEFLRDVLEQGLCDPEQLAEARGKRWFRLPL